MILTYILIDLNLNHDEIYLMKKMIIEKIMKAVEYLRQIQNTNLRRIKFIYDLF